MAQVIDASVAVAWCADSQATPLTTAALKAANENGGSVPAIFWFEVLYALAGLEFRGVVSQAEIDAFVVDLGSIALTIDAAYDNAGILNLHSFTRQYGVSIYDAAYLELALRLNLPLATRDSSLTKAAQDAGVPLFTA